MTDPTDLKPGNPERSEPAEAEGAATAARRPSPTSRARRAGAVAVSSAAQRPAPRPHSDPAPAGSDTLTAEPEGPKAASAAGATRTAAAAGAAGAAATVGTATAAVAAEATGQPGGRSHRRRRNPLLLTAVLLVAVLAAAVLNWWLWQSKDTTGSQTQRQRVLSSAKTAVPAILSYNYKSFDKSVAAGRSMLTGRAQTDYVTAMNGSIKPTAVKNTAVVLAQTDAAGIESVSPTGKQVTLVVFGEQKVTNATLTAPRTDLFRVRVTMDLVNGNWLVSKFDQI